MVDGLVETHLDRLRTRGAELLAGEVQFTDPKAVEIQRNDGGKRVNAGERVFLDLGAWSKGSGYSGVYRSGV